MDNLIARDNRVLEKQVETALAKAEKSFAIWNRSHSNFAWTNIIVGTQYMPCRRLRQISAELSKKKDALTEVKYKYLEKRKRAELKRHEAKGEEDELKKEYLLLKAEQLEATAEMVRKPYVGAIKDVLELTRLYTQIEQQITNEYGKLDEEVFEIEEAKYWVMRSFAQSLRDIRQTGVIHAGNQELLEQIGLDPSVVQQLLVAYLQSNARETFPSSIGLETFLSDCAEEYYKASLSKMKRLGFSEIIEKNNIFVDESCN